LATKDEATLMRQVTTGFLIFSGVMFELIFFLWPSDSGGRFRLEASRRDDSDASMSPSTLGLIVTGVVALAVCAGVGA
jgi:hypothetical protein